MIETILTLVIVFFAITLFGHVSHYCLHQKWSGRLNRAHMTHHLKLYPPSDYVSDVYRNPGKDNTVIIFAMLSLPVLITPILLCLIGKLSIFLTIVAVVEMLVVGLLHDRIHDAFHLTKSIWHKVPGFKRWNRLHYLHHVDMQTNFGIFSFHWDKIFGTYWSKN